MGIKLFGNVLAYRLTNALPLHQDHEAINQALASRPARDPGPLELNKVGFVPPIGEQGQYLQRVSPMAYVICYRIAERQLPAKIVRRHVDAAVREIQEGENRKVYAREKQQLKDKVIQELLPRAFIDYKTTYALISGQYVFIDSSSAKRGEDVLSTLRECLGSLGVRPVTVNTTPIDAFTRWVRTHQTDGPFYLTGDFQAQNRNDESDSLKAQGTSFEDDRLSDLATQDRRVTVLGLQWETGTGEAAAFTVNEMIGIKGIKWPESIAEQAASQAGDYEDPEQLHKAMLLATFTLLAAELKQLLADLLVALGGEHLQDGQEEDDEALAIQTLRRAGEAYMTRFNATLVESDSEEDEGPDDNDTSLSGERDALYTEAVEFVRETKRASISAIQRKFKIGYNRAARLIELLEDDGVVTPMNSNGSRDVIRASSTVNQAAAIKQQLTEMDDLI